ncbi:unnamed protein product, partial [Discosporangium mesarthrocarpum]
MAGVMESHRSEAVCLRDIVSFLLRERLFASAEIVGSFFLCTTSLPSHPAELRFSLHADALSMYADALKGKGEHKRASMYYKQAVQHRKLAKGILVEGDQPETLTAKISTPGNPCVREISGTAHMSNPPSVSTVNLTESQASKEGIRSGAWRRGGVEAWRLVFPPDLFDVQVEYLPLAELKFKEAQCLITGGDTGAAISSLEAILPYARTAEMSITLAQTYRNSNLKRNACSVYKRALRENPLVVEAIVPLLEMGMTAKEVVKILEDKLPTCPLGVSLSDLPWLTLFVDGHAFSCNSRPKDALEQFLRIENLYSANLMALLQVGKAYMDLDLWDEAYTAFRKARLADEMNMDLMDCYGIVMRQKSMPGGLNRLSHELLSVNPGRPETWVVAALYSEVRGDRDRAVKFVDKALELRPQHALAHILKGSLVLAGGDVQAAHVSFQQANTIRKDIHSFKG